MVNSDREIHHHKTRSSGRMMTTDSRMVDTIDRNESTDTHPSDHRLFVRDAARVDRQSKRRLRMRAAADKSAADT